jgi:S-adenosylmethionine decarboxylase
VNILGKHLLLDLGECDRRVLNDLDFLRNTLLSIAEISAIAVRGETFHRFEPHGVSGVVLIAGAHISIHTWPEFGFAAIDIYDHNKSLNLEKIAKFLIKELESKSPSIVELKRGLMP